MPATKNSPSKKASAKPAPAKQATPPAKAKISPPTKLAKPTPVVKKLSALDAAVKVLSEAHGPLTTGEMIEAMAKKGYWKSPGGQTPAATLYSAILRELKTKGKDARFTKAERGKFGLAK